MGTKCSTAREKVNPITTTTISSRTWKPCRLCVFTKRMAAKRGQYNADRVHCLDWRSHCFERHPTFFVVSTFAELLLCYTFTHASPSKLYVMPEQVTFSLRLQKFSPLIPQCHRSEHSPFFVISRIVIHQSYRTHVFLYSSTISFDHRTIEAQYIGANVPTKPLLLICDYKILFPILHNVFRS